MLPRLHLVTNDALLRQPSFATQAEAILDACGADVALHLRGHDTSGRVLYELGERLAAASLRSGSWLFINDRVDIAMAVRARGAQLGERSLPVSEARLLLGRGAWLGFSAHDMPDVTRALADGADFVVLGTIFSSASHALREPAGVPLVEECVSVGLPVIAIGGVSVAHVSQLARAGAYGAAVISGVWQAPDPVAAAAQYVDALRREPGSAAMVQRSGV